MTFNSSLFLEEIISLEIPGESHCHSLLPFADSLPGTGRYFFLVSLESEFSVFGEDLKHYVRGRGQRE